MNTMHEIVVDAAGVVHTCGWTIQRVGKEVTFWRTSSRHITWTIDADGELVVDDLSFVPIHVVETAIALWRTIPAKMKLEEVSAEFHALDEHRREWKEWGLVPDVVCSVCDGPVRRVPGGTCCEQGHGGAPLKSVLPLPLKSASGGSDG